MSHWHLFAGVGLGFSLRGIKMTDREIRFLSFPGELLMRVLQMSVLPLIISSLITGEYNNTNCIIQWRELCWFHISQFRNSNDSAVASPPSGMSSVNRNSFGRTGLKALIFYTVTTIIAAFTGILLAVLIQPGISSGLDPLPSSGDSEVVQTADSFLDLIRCVTKRECEKNIIIS